MELPGIRSPKDIRHLSNAQLGALAKQIRMKIVDTVAINGGHLASSLGTVELTLALHSVFNAPEDKIIWDVGHQTYTHKLITGRYDEFDSLRKLGGISGFPKRAESEYDVYDTGHASGSISFAAGVAKARDLSGKHSKVIAVIGDGALTSGVAYEGLNNAGSLNTPIVVILNDNSMSISKNTGGIAQYLTLLRLAPGYRSAKAAVEKALDHMPSVGPFAISWLRRFKGGLKYLFFPEAWFEALGFIYYGPIDGHDISRLKRVFEEIKSVNEPVFVHVVTKKGKGYAPAEKQPEKFHGPGPFDPATGEFIPPAHEGPAYNRVFGQAMLRFGEKVPELVAVTAAMADGTGLKEFGVKFPERFFDVGIAESHAVTFAAGLARGGMLPVVCIYSTFLQRAYDQVIEDVCLQKLKVVFAIDRAGIVGEDGETHHGQFDISFLRTVPGLTIMAPKDEQELVNMLWTALEIEGPCAIRYPRGQGVGVPFEDSLREPKILTPGKAEVIVQGSDINILALGSMVQPAVEASEILAKRGVSCGVINARFVAPLDTKAITDIVNRAPVLVAEENISDGGFGEAVTNFAGASGRDICKLALPLKFIAHGSQKELRRILGLDTSAIVRSIEEILAR